MITESTIDLGTVYPSDISWECFEERRQKVADEVNGGRLGEKIRVSTNYRGVETFFMPELNVTWKQDFS